MCVCLCKREKQLLAYVLFVDNTSTSAVKISVQDGKMGVKRRGRSEIIYVVHKFMKLESELIITILLAKVQESHGSNMR